MYKYCHYQIESKLWISGIWEKNNKSIEFHNKFYHFSMFLPNLLLLFNVGKSISILKDSICHIVTHNRRNVIIRLFLYDKWLVFPLFQFLFMFLLLSNKWSLFWNYTEYAIILFDTYYVVWLILFETYFIVFDQSMKSSNKFKFMKK